MSEEVYESTDLASDLDVTDWDELVDEIESRSENSHGEVAKVFEGCLTELRPIDLNDVLGLPPEVRPNRAQKVVPVIAAILAALSAQGSDLMVIFGRLCCFTGRYWERVEPTLLIPFLSQAALRLGLASFDAIHFSFVEDLVKQTMSVTARHTEKQNDGASLMNCLNATIEISSTGITVREHRKDDLLCHLIPHRYDPDAKYPLWQNFLDRVLPDPSSQMIFGEFIGSAFFEFKHEKALVLLGSGNNGKSVALDVLARVLGPDSVTHQSLESLNSEYHRAQLAGYKLNWTSEIGKHPKASIFKKMVSGEPIDARHPYGKPFIFHEQIRFAFNCNELPRDVEHTDAFFRRFLIVPFKEQIPAWERNPRLAGELVEKEASGILNWVLEGVDRFLKQGGFTHSADTEEAINEYRLESDSVALFLYEYDYKKSIKKVKLTDMHCQYRQFCSYNVYKPVSARTMHRRINELGFESRRQNNGVVIFVESELISVPEFQAF